MQRQLLSSLLCVALTGCNDYCFDLDNKGVCERSPCYVPSDANGDGDTSDTGDPLANAGECTELYRAQFFGTDMICGGVVSEAEHCTQDAVSMWGTPDFDIYSDHTKTVKFDFIPITEVNDPDEPGATYWTWTKNWSTALPIVVEHPDNFGGTAAAYASKGCCAQRVTSPDAPPDWIPHHPDCQGGNALVDTPMGWCLDFGGPEDNYAGGCVYPCNDIGDCPEQTTMHCDITRPDPMGQAIGTCRANSTPAIPTQLADIGH